jgi:hypothetical protein
MCAAGGAPVAGQPVWGKQNGARRRGTCPVAAVTETVTHAVRQVVRGTPAR